MISDKALDLFVAVAIFVLALFAVGALMTWGLGQSGFSVSEPDQQSPDLIKKDGIWVVSGQEKSITELQDGPAINLIPYRQEISPVGKISSERQSLAKSVEAFLSRWESFDPNEIRAALVRGRPDPYQAQIRPWSTPNQVQDLARRIDAADPPGVGVNQAAGLNWISAGQVDQSLQIGTIENNQAWVWIPGLVEYRARRSDNNVLDGQLINRLYSLLLEKQKGRWLVSRAAVEPGQPLSR